MVSLLPEGPDAKITCSSFSARMNAQLSIEVTLLGITTSPAQFVFPVTTLFVIVSSPVVQVTVSVSAHTGVATTVVTSKPNTAASDNFFDFSNN